MRLLTRNPDFENILDSLESGEIDLSGAIEKLEDY
jgi:exonuclease VII small subunit